MRSKPLATTSSQGQRRIKKCNGRWQEVYRDMGPVAEWWSLCSQLDRYLDYIGHFDISHNAPSWQRERYVNLIHLRSLDSNKQAGPFWERPVNKETRAFASLQKVAGQGVPCIPVDLRFRQNNKLDPAVQEYLERLSFYQAEHFATPPNSERQQPSLSSSWSPSPTWWSSSSWDQSWQKWHSWVARPKVVRQKVRKTKLDSRCKKGLWKVGVSEKFNVVQVNLWVLIPWLVLQQLFFC